MYIEKSFSLWKYKIVTFSSNSVLTIGFAEKADAYMRKKTAKYILYMCCTVFTVLVFEPIGIEGSVPKSSEFSMFLLSVTSPFIFAFLVDHMSDILFLNQSSPL